VIKTAHVFLRNRKPQYILSKFEIAVLWRHSGVSVAASNSYLCGEPCIVPDLSRVVGTGEMAGDRLRKARLGRALRGRAAKPKDLEKQPTLLSQAAGIWMTLKTSAGSEIFGASPRSRNVRLYEASV
jgi:hypothetical protein